MPFGEILGLRSTCSALYCVEKRHIRELTSAFLWNGKHEDDVPFEALIGHFSLMIMGKQQMERAEDYDNLRSAEPQGGKVWSLNEYMNNI